MENLKQYPLQSRRWIATETKKTHIVLHGSFSRTKYTPFGKEDGRDTSVIDNWNASDEKFGAPYLIGRDGTIYQTFDDKEWIYHLGIPGTKGYYDKISIPIMLANELNLNRENGRNYALGHTFSTNQYFGPTFQVDWRGQQYFAKLDAIQVDSTIDLILGLCAKHNINPVLYGDNDWNPKVWDKATIFTHANCRKDVYDLYLEPWVIDKFKAKGIEVASS